MINGIKESSGVVMQNFLDRTFVGASSAVLVCGKSVLEVQLVKESGYFDAVFGRDSIKRAFKCGQNSLEWRVRIGSYMCRSGWCRACRGCKGCRWRFGSSEMHSNSCLWFSDGVGLACRSCAECRLVNLLDTGTLARQARACSGRWLDKGWRPCTLAGILLCLVDFVKQGLLLR